MVGNNRRISSWNRNSTDWLEGIAISRNRINDTVRNRLLIPFIVNEASLTLMRHESALKQDGRMLHAGKNAETRPLDATIKGIGAQFLFHRTMHRRSQGNIG